MVSADLGPKIMPRREFCWQGLWGSNENFQKEPGERDWQIPGGSPSSPMRQKKSYITDSKSGEFQCGGEN